MPSFFVWILWKLNTASRILRSTLCEKMSQIEAKLSECGPKDSYAKSFSSYLLSCLLPSNMQMLHIFLIVARLHLQKSQKIVKKFLSNARGMKVMPGSQKKVQFWNWPYATMPTINCTIINKTEKAFSLNH